jgi:hypothetical protein
MPDHPAGRSCRYAVVVLTGIAIGAVVLALWYVLRWSTRRYDSLGRKRPFPRIGFGLALLLVVAAGLPAYQHARLERRLSAAAGGLVGTGVSVHCQTFGEAWTDLGSELGYVRFDAGGVPEKKALIKLEPCHDLANWLKVAGQRRKAGAAHPPASNDREQIIAVHVLAHEAMHMSGLTDEAVAECAAMQRDARLARSLGATEEGARSLARHYWLVVYPDMPDDYRSSECRPGGALDEHRPDAPWLALTG